MIMSLYSEAIKIQEKLAKRVIIKDAVSKIKNICAVDVSYKKDTAYCSAVVMDRKSLNQLEFVNTKISVKQPYIPGLLMLRESEPILHTVKKLKTDFQLLLVDGHGQLHPRRCGLACYLGITLDMPTIGVAKSLLCGSIKGSVVKLDGTIVGAVIQKKEKKKIFVSIGHKISLKSAVKIVDEMILDDQWLPEPLRIADVNSKNQKLFGNI
ncbi:MAG: endonuclease V [Nitrosopumilaceae archaeon]